MIRLAFILALAGMLAACEAEWETQRRLSQAADPSITHQCLRREIFRECMAALPKGPERITGGNDWDEVVDSCESAARYQALRRTSTVPMECRP